MKQLFTLLLTCCAFGMALAQTTPKGRTYSLEFQVNDYVKLNSLIGGGWESSISWTLKTHMEFQLEKALYLRTGLHLMCLREENNMNRFIIFESPTIDPNTFLLNSIQQQTYLLSIPVNFLGYIGPRKRFYFTIGGGPAMAMLENQQLIGRNGLGQERLFPSQTAFPTERRIGWQMNTGIGYQLPLGKHGLLRLQPAFTLVRSELRREETTLILPGIQVGLGWRK
jgi:hypothetical protein